MESSSLQAIRKYACTRFSYSTIRGIDGPVQQLELDGIYFIFSLLSPYRLTYLYSRFLAERLKYLYLLFDDTNSFKLDEWVCNTEARFLPST